jgi:superfamily II DNA/RNA helicase
VNEVSPCFDNMDLKEDLLRGIYAHGFERPCYIQQRAIKPMLLIRDIIVQAYPGVCELN